MKRPVLLLLGLLAASLIPVQGAGAQLGEPPREPLARDAEILSWGPDPAAIRGLRDAIDRLRSELERREERRDLILRQERALYEIALETGLDSNLPPDRVFPLEAPEPVLLPSGRADLRAALSGPAAPADPTGERFRALDRYRQWLDRAGRGDVGMASLGAAALEVREAAADQRALMGQAIQAERESRDEILRLTGEIRRQIASIEPPSSEILSGDLDALRGAVDDVDSVVEADDLVARATTVDSALTGLLLIPDGPGTR